MYVKKVQAGPKKEMVTSGAGTSPVGINGTLAPSSAHQSSNLKPAPLSHILPELVYKVPIWG